jgi:hypothetical protein
MSRIIQRAVSTWLGFDRGKLPEPWMMALDIFTDAGGSAEKKLGGPIKSVEIL